MPRNPFDRRQRKVSFKGELDDLRLLYDDAEIALTFDWLGMTSKTLAIDETPIKAGRAKGRMKTAWYWPVYGEADEVAFTWPPSRGRGHLERLLDGFDGTLLSDGAGGYARFAAERPALRHAQCWSHTRRAFVKAETLEPEAVAAALALIGRLYDIEADLRERPLEPEQVLIERSQHALPAVDAFFAWCRTQCQRMDLTLSNPLAKAIAYAREREGPLRVYLGDPHVAIDTNHLERALRSEPMGRKNWLFCWTEVGAEKVGIMQSLLTTCRLQGVDPYRYLVDVLQRVALHPDSRVDELTPRRWKSLFADQPLRSDLELVRAARCKLQLPVNPVLDWSVTLALKWAAEGTSPESLMKAGERILDGLTVLRKASARSCEHSP